MRTDVDLRVTAGVQMTCTILVFFGSPYSIVSGLAYVALSSAMACRVFRMVLLCKRDIDPLNTADIDDIFRAVSVHGGV